MPNTGVSASPSGDTRPWTAKRSRIARASAPESPVTGPYVARPQSAMATGEREGPGFGIIEANAQLRLEPELILGKKLLFEESQRESLSQPVIFDDRRHVSKLPPVAEYGADARSGLLAQADATECGDDSGIANLLLAGFE